MLDKARHAQLLGRDEHKAHSLVAAHRRNERVHCAAVVQVAANAYGQAVEGTLFVLYRQQVGQGLGRVIVPAVARVDYGHARVALADYRRALEGVAHRDYVGIAADNLEGVGDRLALCGARRVRLGEAEHPAAQRQHRRLKAQARARRRLKKERRQYLAAAKLRILLSVCHNVVGNSDKTVDLLGRQIENVDEISHLFSPIQLSSLGQLRNLIRRLTSSGRM